LFQLATATRAPDILPHYRPWHAACLRRVNQPTHKQHAHNTALRPKAARLVGAKCSLLARIDAYGQDPDGQVRAHGVCAACVRLSPSKLRR
jgi:hypothetical protein